MAEMNKKLTGIIVLIIAIVVIFQLVGSSGDDLTSAASNISNANNCATLIDGAGESANFNSTDGLCYNSTGGSAGAATFLLPLRNLFSPSGVALLVFMASLLILIVIVVLKDTKGIGKK